MKMQIKNSLKIATGIAFLVALLFITAFKSKENIGKTQNTSDSQTIANSLYIDILTMSDKVEALRNFVVGEQEIHK